MNLKISIENPCHENWEGMKKQEGSRFCASCEKSVLDFTSMNRAEIEDYFVQNSGKKVCGHFKRSQLDFPPSYPEVTIYPIYKHAQKSSVPFYLLTASTLFLASCSGEAPSDTHQASHVKGAMEIEVPADSTVSTCSKDEKTLVMGKAKIISPEVTTIDPPEEVLTGDVAYIEKEPSIPEVFTFVDEQAEFKGGYQALKHYLKTNLKYPQWELDNKIEGKIHARFMVGKDGTVSNVRIIRSVTGSKNFDGEVIRLLSAMPTWKPAKVDGKAVDSYFDLPVSFKLP